VTLVWSNRDMDAFEWFGDMLQEAADSFPMQGGKSNLKIHLRLFCTRSAVPAAGASASAAQLTFRDQVLAGRPPMDKVLAGVQPLEKRTPVSGATTPARTSSSLDGRASGITADAAGFSYAQMEDGAEGAGMGGGGGGGRKAPVAVFFCGPGAQGDGVAKEVGAANRARGDIRFDLHKETFAL
jgi:hypothetical protein